MPSEPMPDSLHARAADANKLNGRMLSTQSPHQASAENIARSFASHQGDAQGRAHDQRVMPRLDACTESRNKATSGNCAADSAISAMACSTVKPWR